MKVHRFRSSLAWEQQQGELLARFWSGWWPGAQRRAVQDLSRQRAGVDAVVDGLVVSARSPARCTEATVRYAVEVEEKVRDRDYGDVLLELVSVDRTGAPGWAVKPARSRLLLYAIKPTRRAFVFPMQAVQSATRARADDWCRRYGKRVARNATYRSINVPVPLSEFVRAVDEEHGIVFCPACRMLCDWSDLRGPSWCSTCTPTASFEVRA